jgi:hypothetical protein
MDTTVLPDRLRVCFDTTPGAHRTDSDDIFWWLPIIGPTATVLAYTLTRHTARTGTAWDTHRACPADRTRRQPIEAARQSQPS